MPSRYQVCPVNFLAKDGTDIHSGAEASSQSSLVLCPCFYCLHVFGAGCLVMNVHFHSFWNVILDKVINILLDYPQLSVMSYDVYKISIIEGHMMAKNQVQFQHGYGLFEFMDTYGTEKQCEQALFQWRFPNGYVCPECGHTTYCQLKCRKLLQCNHCGHQHSLISGTLFQNTKLPLTKWFLAMYLLTQSKTECSAMALKRALDVNYDTAWKLKHKLLQAMK